MSFVLYAKSEKNRKKVVNWVVVISMKKLFRFFRKQTFFLTSFLYTIFKHITSNGWTSIAHFSMISFEMRWKSKNNNNNYTFFASHNHFSSHHIYIFFRIKINRLPFHQRCAIYLHVKDLRSKKYVVVLILRFSAF